MKPSEREEMQSTIRIVCIDEVFQNGFRTYKGHKEYVSTSSSMKESINIFY